MGLDPMLIRCICDFLSIRDLGRLSRCNTWLRNFVKNIYEIDHLLPHLYWPPAWEEIIRKRIKLDHQTIREWNPDYGKAYVYAYFFKKNEGSHLG